MRTAAICPTCATYYNALCVLYNGPYLVNIDLEDLESVNQAITNINFNLVPKTGVGAPIINAVYLGQLYLDTSTGNFYYAKSIGAGPLDWTLIDLTVGVLTVTGLNTDNTDPANPIINISVDGITVSGDGTPGNPLVSVASAVALTSTEVGYGSALNLITSSSGFTYDPVGLIFNVGFGLNNYLNLNATTGGYAFGDVSGAGNNTQIIIDDILRTTTVIGAILITNGGYKGGYIAVNANTIVVPFMYVIDCTSGTFPVNLPAAATDGDGKIYFVKNSGAGIISLTADGLELIDGINPQLINPGECLQVCCTGTGWIII